MTKIRLSLKKTIDNSYDIQIENGLFHKIPDILGKKKYGKKYAIICDETVSKLYGSKLLKSLQKAKIPTILISFPDGEDYKNMGTVEDLLNILVTQGYDRKDCVIALGGGVSGDTAGFTASIYKRGINYIHVPTSLLAMVDSSIGGKTGVNLAEGKNFAGTITQPKVVLMDPELLETLPDTELLSGMSEALKNSILWDEKYFELIEKNVDKIHAKDKTVLNKIITQSVQMKSSVVEKDEKENKLRMILNYGHTVGHAIEKLSNYKINHGIAVAIGMKVINRICYKKKLLKKTDLDRINNVINALNLIPKKHESIIQKKNLNEIWEIMQSDKKVYDGKIHFVISKSIGSSDIYTNISKKDLESAIINYE